MKQFSGLLALDPGKTTGWALFDKNAVLMKYGQASMNEVVTLDKFIEEYNLSHIVAEDFKLFRHKAQRQIGSRFEASQVIGMAKAWAAKFGCELILQGSNIKPIAERFSQVTPPSNHANSHWVDAYNHGFYYLVKTGLRKSALEEAKDEAAKKDQQGNAGTSGVTS